MSEGPPDFYLVDELLSGTFYGVHSNLAMQAIDMLGSDEQRERWLPGMAALELVGDVRVPEENRLERCRSFRDVADVLTRTRYTVAWRALGIALAAYETAPLYARGRDQFGQPIASYQLVQDKLSRMLAEITAMARHHADMEAIFTFEGTDSVQSMIVGREITGISAIAPGRRSPEGA